MSSTRMARSKSCFCRGVGRAKERIGLCAENLFICSALWSMAEKIGFAILQVGIGQLPLG